MALRDFLNKSKYNEPIGFGDSAPTLAIKLGKKLFGDKTTTRTLPNNGGTYTTPTVGVQPQKDFQGLYGTNQNYEGPGGFNYAFPQQQTQTLGEDLNTYPTGSFETPNTDIQYTAGKLNELAYSSSPMDLFSLRQRLARDQALAKVGQLPGDNAQNPIFDGMGITDGAPRYNYEQRMGVNDATSDMYAPQIEALDDWIKSKGTSVNGSSIQSFSSGGIPQELSGINVDSIIQLAGTGGTADERAYRRQQIANSLATGGVQGFINELQTSGQEKMSTTQREDYQKLSGNIDGLQTAIGYMQEYNGDLGNITKLKKKLGETFGYQDPAYAAIGYLTESVSAAERQKIFGASLTGGEQEAASKFVITPKDTKEVAIQKAKAMMIAMQMAQEIRPLLSAGMTPTDVQKLKNSGVIKSYTDRLIENGITPPAKPSFPYTQVGSDGKKYRVISANEVVPLDSFNRVGSGTKTASGQVSSLQDAMRRIARNESDGSGGYMAIGPVVQKGMYKGQRAIGKYQVMQGNIAPWSKEILGYSVTPQQFYNNPQLQDQIVAGKMQQYYKRYGNWGDVASAWFTGGPLAKNANKKDTFGTTGAQYVNKFLS